jgi:drug/metabolite transporter (DMT)-like permease
MLGAGMSRRSWIMFLSLAALWGASYLFIKVALEDQLAPAFIVFARTALAALVLLPLAAHLGALVGLRERLAPLAVLGLVQVTGPFTLITVGEQEISSSLTGILVAAAPIFTFLLAFALEGEERASALSLGGVAIGIAGVALLLGVDAPGGVSALVGGLLVVLATTGYAIGAWFLKRRVPGVQPVGAVAVTCAASSLMTLPVALFSLPDHVPSLEAAGSLAVLGVGGTGIAFVLFYSLVAREGPSQASLVAYVAPGFSVVYGVTLLDERFTPATAAGLVLIVGGSWLAAESRLPWQPRSAAGGELPAGGVDIAPAREPDGGADPAVLEGGPECGDPVPA